MASTGRLAGSGMHFISEADASQFRLLGSSIHMFGEVSDTPPGPGASIAHFLGVGLQEFLATGGQTNFGGVDNVSRFFARGSNTSR